MTRKSTPLPRLASPASPRRLPRPSPSAGAAQRRASWTAAALGGGAWEADGDQEAPVFQAGPGWDAEDEEE